MTVCDPGGMTFRPYPSVDRALAQVYRHAPTAPAIPMPPALQSVVAGFAQMRVSAQRALETRRRLAALRPDDDATDLVQSALDEQGYVSFPVGEYRLSTR